MTLPELLRPTQDLIPQLATYEKIRGITDVNFRMHDNLVS